MDFETFDTNIENSLAREALLLSADHLQTLEDEVWADLDASIKGGWRTEEEAYATFMQWRARYISIGRSAVK